MPTLTRLFQPWCGMLASACTILLLTGCQSARQPESAPSTPTASAAAAPARPAIRINAGASAPLTDSSGNVWLPDRGFAGGMVTLRADDLPIANTKDPAIYRTETFGMTAFTQEVPNGKYTVKLHFAETYDGVSGPGQRVFSFTVEGKEFPNFDPFAKAGGARRAYVETVDVDVTDGRLDIAFRSNVQNPAINGIEIIPAR